MLDIENKPTGEVLAIGVSRRSESGKTIRHLQFSDWDVVLDYLFGLKKGKGRVRSLMVWAHNGGGWDYCSLLHHILLCRNEEYRVFPFIAGSRFVLIKLERVRDHRQLTLCDSLNHFQCPLQHAIKRLLGPDRGKVEFAGSHESLFMVNRKLFDDYLRVDCDSLVECLEQYEQLINRIAPIGNLTCTPASTSLKAFRTHLRKPLYCPRDENFREMLREGYTGGRVEVFQPGNFEVRIYDVNSMYPFVMRRNKFPSGEFFSKTESFHPGNPGVYRVETYSDLPIKPVPDGESVLFSPELALLIELKQPFKILEGYVCLEDSYLFSEYIEKLWKMRQENRGGALEMAAKIMGNSLYGKFAQRGTASEIVVASEREVQDRFPDCGYEPVDLMGKVWLISNPKEFCRHENVSIAGMVTSYARVELYKWFLRAGSENVLYCDTDSIHVHSHCSLPESTEMGELKLEYSGEAIYCGKKLYARRDKVRAKGVSCGIKEHQFNLTWEHFITMLNGGRISTSFTRPATARETLKGAAPCSFQNRRTRTLRMTTLKGFSNV